jgi:subfamily B ATP-binding cassette protein MsbA
MLGYLKPYIGLFILVSVLSLVITSIEGIALWLLGSMPQALFNAGGKQTVLADPGFSIATINEWLKFKTSLLIGTGTHHSLVVLCILIAVLFSSKNVLSYLSFMGTQLLNLRITRDMRSALYNHILRLPISYFDKNRSGDISASIINDVSQVLMSLSGALNQIIIEPIRLFFYVGLLFLINWKLTLAVFIVYPLTALLIVQIGKAVKRRSARWLTRFSDIMSTLSESIQCIRVIKTFGKELDEARRFSEYNLNFLKSYLRYERVRLTLSPLTELLGVYVSLGLLLYGGSEIMAGSPAFTGSDFFRFLIILFASYKPLKALGTVNSTVQGGIAAAERVFKLLDSPVEPVHQEVNPIHLQKGIALCDVHFRYGDEAPEVLKGLSFDIPKGTKVALVGPSGAGKTTILDLLPRFYNITGGSITVDGQDTRTVDLSSLRAMFGTVSQETVLFDDTIKANIAYGNDKATDEQITEAARAANALEFIEKFPNGMATKVGERGVALSGGQRQRIAIARAILKNPQILILDEATSALDTESERLVQAAIERLMENRTALVVAHRLSTIRNADKIIVLENGVTVEQGTHTELYALGRRYRYYHDIQFAKHDSNQITT